MPRSRSSIAAVWLVVMGALLAAGVPCMAADSAVRLAAAPTATTAAGPIRSTPRTEPAAAAQCKVGRRGYCFKYKGVCETNAVGRRDCNGWFAACMRCHDAADACGTKTAGSTPQCAHCSSTWSACMDRSYSQHWPKPHRYKP